MLTMYDVITKASKDKYGNAKYSAEFQSELYSAIKDKIQYRDEIINKNRAATAIYNEAWGNYHTYGYERVAREADELIEFLSRCF